LSVTQCNLSFGTRGFRTAAPTIWNSLPANVRSSETLSTFRRHLKSHLFIIIIIIIRNEYDYGGVMSEDC